MGPEETVRSCRFFIVECNYESSPCVSNDAGMYYLAPAPYGSCETAISMCVLRSKGDLVPWANNGSINSETLHHETK